jgi:hypothetical protein
VSDKVISFVTICNQRSASKFISSCFAYGIDVIPLGEIFNPDNGQILSYWGWLQENGHDRKINQTTEATLDLFFAQIFERFGPFSFDLMYNQIPAICPAWSDSPNFFILDYFKNKGFNILNLTRNPLDIFISLKTLEKTNTPHQTSEIKTICLPEETSEFILNPMEFSQFHTRIRTWDSIINSFFTNYTKYLHIDYADIDFSTGILPDSINNFCSKILFEHMNKINEQSDKPMNTVQLYPNWYGKSPLTNITIVNFDELNRINLELVSAKKVDSQSQKNSEC